MNFNLLPRTFTVCALLCWGLLQPALYAQISIGGKPYSFTHGLVTKSLPAVKMPEINLPKLQAEDVEEELAGIPPRFGFPIEANLNMDNSGKWENLPDGGRLWRLNIEAPGAKSINLLYNDFYLPSNGVLYIYSADRKHLIGGFTSANNKSDRVFATGLIYSDHIVLEYYETPANRDKAQVDPQQPVSIGINYVVHGYRHISLNKDDLEKAFNDSGDCNVNTICSQGDDWRDQIKSVALMLVGGIRWCTGYLVNNTAEDCRPLFLTANHCLSTFDAINNPNANTFSFVWRYESPNCTPDTDGPTNMTTSGATVLANPGSPGDVVSGDFALLELAESPKDAGYDVYFAGFDATTTAPAAATGIHHPAGDVKKISMENNPLTATDYGGTGGTPTHWRIADWDSGTTEGGSSGSPIFSNATKRAIGFLSGGFALCGNNLPDWYGQMGYSWDNAGATDSRRRLRDHLDPGGLATFVDGSADPCGTAPSCDTYSSAANLNLAIPNNDPAGVSSTINVGASGTIAELKCVTVNMAHTFTGDLVATLTHVSSGTSVQLFRRLNASSMSSFGESSNLDGTYTFCATGASFAAAGTAGGTDYVIPSGTYAQSSASLQVTPPANPNTYADFTGLDITGDWRLTIADYAAADFGTLRDWNFEVCTAAAPACIPATAYNVTGDGSSCAPNGPTLPIGLNNSQTGYTYELFRDGNSVTTAAGTGSPLAFGSYNTPGTYTVVATEDGNSTCTADMSGSAVITQDVTPPSITCPGTQTVSCASAVPPVNINDVIINSGGPAMVIHVGDAISNQTCANRYTITRTYRATDVCGNPIDCEQTITVNDQTPPMVTAGSINPCYATQVAAEAAAIAATTASADNCGGAVTKTASTMGSCSAEITVTATDVCGNSASVTYNTRIDNTPPTLVCKNATVFIDGTGNYTLTDADVFNAGASSDNCPGALTVMSISPASVSCAQLDQTIPVTVMVKDGCGNTATCIAQITVQEGMTLPAGWSSNNVGNANGSAGYKACGGGEFTVTAVGFSTSSSDVLHLASQQLCGNGEIIAHIASVNNAGWAGITLRESLSQGSKMVALKTQSNGNIRRMIRTVTNGPVNNLNYSRPQHDWLRLTRSGSAFVGYTSMDGVNWTFAFSANVSMTGCLYAGLFAESINGNVTTTAVFDNVSITGGTPLLLTPGNTLAATAPLDFQVYPNPTTGEVTVDLSAYTNRIVYLQLYDVQGKALKMLEIDAAETATESLDLSVYQDGLYLIRIQSEGLPDATKRVVLSPQR